MTDSPSASLDSDRYLWHPSVHARYLESCYFYLISGRRLSDTSDDTFSDSIRSLAIELGLVSASVHVVYGTYDALVRIWATEPARRKFVNGLRDVTASRAYELSAVREFNANEVRYFFGQCPPTLEDRTIETNLDAIQRVAVEDYFQRVGVALPTDRPPAKPDDRDRLLGARILIPVEDVPGVKFYMFLSEGEAHRGPSRETAAQLVEGAEALGLANASVYAGGGFCSYIVKAVAPDYTHLLPAVNGLRRVAKAHAFDPWTLPVADYLTAHFGESLDAVVTDVPGEIERFLGRVDQFDLRRPQLREAVYSLRTEQQQALSSLLREASDVLSVDHLEWFSEIVATGLLKDRKNLNRSLSFLTSLEADLRDFVPRSLSGIHGQEWLRRLREDAQAEKQSGANWESSGPNKWSLYDLLQVLVFAQRYPTFADNFEPIAGTAWQSAIREIAQVRDEFAHGYIFEIVTTDSFEETWGARLRAISRAFAIQNLLERFSTTTNDPLTN